MSLWPTICWGSSCGGLPSAGTIQPRCCPHGCFLRVITASNPQVRTRAVTPANAPARRSCGLWSAKMERVPEALQLPVIVEGRRPLALKRQPLEKLDFLRGRRAAERRILEEFLEPGLLADRLFGFPLDKLESLRLPWDDAVVEDNLQTERRKVDVPGFNQRIQERDAVLSGHVEDVRIEELEHDDPHLLIAAATEPSHHPEPVVILEFVFRHALDHVEQRLGDEAFELAEGLRFKDRADEFLPLGITLAQDQLADFVKQGGGLVPQFPLQFFLALEVRQLRQLPRRELQELVDPAIDVGAARRGGRLLPSQQLRYVGVGHAGGAGEILLLQPQFLQPLPDHKWD